MKIVMRNKIVWFAGVLAAIILLGVLPVKEVVWAGNGDPIPKVTILFDQELNISDKMAVTVTATEMGDPAGNFKTVDVCEQDGIWKADFEDNFFEVGKEYTITTSEIPHYSIINKIYTGSLDDTEVVLELKACEQVTVKGTVRNAVGDAYEGAAVIFSSEGYEDVETTSDEDGKYCVILDKGHTYEYTAASAVHALSKTQKNIIFNEDKDGYDIQMEGAYEIELPDSTEHGKVAIKNDIEYVAEGDSYTIVFSPEPGYRMEKFTINDKDISVDEDEQPGEFAYEVKNVKTRQKIVVSFKKWDYIEVSDLAGAGAEISSENRISSENNVYLYKSNVKAVPLSGTGSVKKIGYEDEDGIGECEFGNVVDIVPNSKISCIYIKGDSGWTAYKLKEGKEILVVADNAAPVVTLERDPHWHKEGPVCIKATVDERGTDFKGKSYKSGIDKVCCKKSGGSEESELTRPDEEGNYVFEIWPDMQGEIDYYVYAVDKAGNISGTENNTVVKFDQSAPSVTSVTFTDGKNISYTDKYGISSSESLRLVIEADDDVKGVNAVSGLDRIIVYRDGEPYDEINDISGDKAEVFLEKKDFTVGSQIQIKCIDKAGNESGLQKLSGIPVYINEKQQTIKNETIVIADAEFALSYELLSDGDNKKTEFQEGQDSGYYINNKAFRLRIRASETTNKTVIGCQKVEVINNSGGKDNKAIYIYDPEDRDTGLEKNEEEYTLMIGGDSDKLKIAPEKNVITVNVYANGADSPTESVKFILYLDQNDPQIREFKFSDAENLEGLETFFTAADGIFYALGLPSFGTYYKNPIAITVDADDRGGSGIDTISLLINGKIVGTKTTNMNKAVFVVDSDIFLVDGKYQEGTVSACARDRVGNSLEDLELYTEPNVENSNIKSAKLMVESIAPTVKCQVLDPVYEDKGNNWYDKDTEFSLKIDDAESGLYNIKITLNDIIVINEHPEVKVTSKTYKVNTKEVDQKKDGSYKMEVTVVDNAGNVIKKRSVIFVDKQTPAISSFEFDGNGYVEGKKTSFGVDKRDYGYYFKNNTTVTVKAADPSASSGLKDITYYTVDKGGQKSQEVTKNVNSKGEISFRIPASFKGQIYALPRDNVLHKTGKYVTPDSAVLETPAQHKKEKHITMEKVSSKHRDSDGRELYKKDVPVSIVITDTYSGIRKVEYSVTAEYDVKKNQSGRIEINNDGEKTKDSADGWERKKREDNLVTKLTGTIKVCNNSNDITVSVKMTDRAGNVSKQKMNFSIDKTNPTIRISYDNNKNDKDNKEYYNKKRTATIVVTERNFNAKDVNYSVTNKDGDVPIVDLTQKRIWKEKKNKKNPDKTTYTAKVKFDQDGKYTWGLAYADRASNPAKKVKKQKFTIDMTKPLITVTYDNTDVSAGNYYKDERAAIITIDEHNFDESRVKIIGSAKNDGKTIVYPLVSSWSQTGDSHRATIEYKEDAEYSLRIKYTDQAGNKASEYSKDTFVVDKTEPDVKISEVKNKSANKNRVAPIVTISDVNFNRSDVDIALSGANRGKIKQLEGSYEKIKNGVKFSFVNFKKEQKFDDMYTLNVSVKDFAGNVQKKEIIFSVNRFGSVYAFDKSLKQIENSYITDEQDVIFTETNVDQLKKKTMWVKLIKNGTPVRLSEGTDYSIVRNGGGGEWCQYIYTIKKDLFSGDGTYSIEVHSEDKATNVNENTSRNKKASISFGVDKTAPVITPIDLESGAQYPTESKKVKIAIKDNLVLGAVTIKLNEREIPYEMEGEDYVINVPASAVKQQLVIAAWDSAGNERKVEIDEFLISTNLIVRWFNNLPLFVGTLVVMVLVILLIVAFIMFKRKKAAD